MKLILSLPCKVRYPAGVGIELKESGGHATRTIEINDVVNLHYGPNSREAKKGFFIELKTPFSSPSAQLLEAVPAVGIAFDMANRAAHDEAYDKVRELTGWKMSTNWKGVPCLFAAGGELGNEFAILAAGEAWLMYELHDDALEDEDRPVDIGVMAHH